jgi:hypothetical protein
MNCSLVGCCGIIAASGTGNMLANHHRACQEHAAMNRSRRSPMSYHPRYFCHIGEAIAKGFASFR